MSTDSPYAKIFGPIIEELRTAGEEPSEANVLREFSRPRPPAPIVLLPAQKPHVLMYGQEIVFQYADGSHEHTESCPECGATCGIALSYDPSDPLVNGAAFTCVNRHTWSSHCARLIALLHLGSL